MIEQTNGIQPRPRRPAAWSSALLCAFVLSVGLASFASAQIIEGHIQLPDSFGVFPAPYQVAWDPTPGRKRLFIGGDSSDMLVVDAVNCEKLARIPTGPVGSVCFNPAHNMLYAVPRGGSSVYVVDGNSYQISKQVQLGRRASGLFYNPIVNRVYCGTSHMQVLDCSSDSVVDSVLGVGAGCVALDSTDNKLYVGTAMTALKVVDCYSDSLVASVERVHGARALCYNSANRRIYAAANESLYAVDPAADSVVGQTAWLQTLHMLVCDPTRNRIYGVSANGVRAWDCAQDTFLWGRSFGTEPDDGPKWLACMPDLDRVYVAVPFALCTFEGTSGTGIGDILVDGRGGPPVYSAGENRLYCLANWGMLAAIDCGADTSIGQALLDAFRDDSPERVCLDTVDNKLYFLLHEYCGCLGVVDCSARQVVTYRTLRYPSNMVHDPLDDKLYVSVWTSRDDYWQGVMVFDCKSDTLVKVIPGVCVDGGLRWHRDLNKVYAGVGDSLGHDAVVVIDCATDSVLRTLARERQYDWFRYSLLTTESDQYWGISDDGYTVVDCERDSIVMDTIMDSWHYPRGVCYSESDRKVYVAHGSAELVVLSTKSLRPMRRIHLAEPGCAVDAMIHVAGAGKIYVALLNEPYADTVYVVDTETDSVVSRIASGHLITAMCDDATGQYVYCPALRFEGSYPYVISETLLVLDTERDTIVSGASMDGLNLLPEWLLPNRRTGRIYAEQDLNGKLLVIRDSAVIGVGEWRGADRVPVRLQTVVKRGVPYRAATRSDLFDATGRRAAVLKPGPNDISHLVPGVYFVREEPQAASVKPQAVRKVVVTR